jgi:hypothetical protein
MNDKIMQAGMKDRAKHMLETYGADLSRWPHTDRDELLQVIKDDHVLSAMMRDEQALDELLNQAPNVVPSLSLQSRILSAQSGDEGVAGTNFLPKTLKQVLDVLWPFGSAAIPAGALVAAIALGGSIGFSTGVASDGWSEEGTYDVVALALGDSTLLEEWQ